MSELLLLVRTAIEPEKDEAFNDWYSTVHCPEMLACDGVLAASRYRLVDTESRHPDYKHPYPRAGVDASRPYLAAYVFSDLDRYDAWYVSEERRRLRADHEARFPQRIPPEGALFEKLVELRRADGA